MIIKIDNIINITVNTILTILPIKLVPKATFLTSVVLPMNLHFELYSLITLILSFSLL